MAKLGLVLGVIVLLVVVLLWPEFPSWRFGGTTSQPLPSVAQGPGLALCPSTGGVIELRGDSHVTGGRMGAPAGSDASPYGRVLEGELGPGWRVILNGRGGATAAEGFALARRNPIAADVLLIAFGTNDAAPRGLLGSKIPVPLGDYQAALGEQIRAAQATGAKVALLAPPPTGSAAMNRRLAPYRQTLHVLGLRYGVSVFDPAEAFAACRAQEPLLTHDALHLNARGHACLGKWLAQTLCGPKR